MPPIQPRIISFDEVPGYVNEGSRNQVCRDFWAEGEVGHVVIGHNVMQGNGRNGTNRHDLVESNICGDQGTGNHGV